MKSIKPGRGPSMMGGVAGIAAVIFGIVWTIIASDAGPAFLIFGILWTVIALVQTVYNFKNATGKNRYSSYDITDSREEPDPFSQNFENDGSSDAAYPEYSRTVSGESRFCPYCGAEVEADFRFCNKCGRELP